MKTELPINNKIDDALESFNHIERAAPSPYFYTKLLGKISVPAVTVLEKWSSFFLRPTVAFASICFIIVTNFFVLYSKYNDNVPVTDTTQLAATEEFNQGATPLYDLENVAP